VKRKKLNLKKIKPEFLLSLIVLFGLILRLIFYTGYVGSDPQDEGIYINYVINLLEGRFNFYRYRELLNVEMINPASTKQFALMLILPSALFSYLLGVSIFSLTLWPLLCSLASIVVIYFLGKELFNEKVGLIAAFLLSFYPLNVFYSTRAQMEMPMLLFSSLSVLFFVRALKSKKLVELYFFLSGLTFALSYYVKTRVVILLLFYAAYFFYLIYKRRFNWRIFYMVGGFMILFLIVGSYFYFQSGDFFLAEHVRMKANQFQIERDPGIKDFWLNPYVHIFNIQSKPFYYLPLIFRQWHHRREVEYFGYFYFVLLISVLWILFRKFYHKMELKNFGILFLWFIILFLFLEFGFLKIELDDQNSHLNYYMMIKNPRYLVILTPPFLITIAYFLNDLNKNSFKLGASILIISFLIITSLKCIKSNHEFFTEGTKDLIIASEFLKENPSKTVYVDYLGLGRLQIMDYSNKGRYKNINSLEREKEFNDSYVILGGSRSVELISKYVYSLEPEFVKNSKSSWEIAKIISGKKTSWRQKDMIIYCIS